jgi:hypothetical protein
MEARFGQDFSQVRVHTGTPAGRAAAALHASAFTVGHDIVFADRQYHPASEPGRRLIAHELTHVAQQTLTGTPLIQRQPEPDVNKSAKFIEETYRSGARQLGDPRLSEAAFNVRRCREEGGYYCEILVTDDDIHSMYAEWSLIESVYGRDKADKAIADHKLREVAMWAAAEKEQPGQTTGALPQGGVAIGSAAPALAPTPTPSGPGTLPSGWTSASPANTNIPAAQSAAGAAESTAARGLASPKPIPVAAAGVALVVVFGVAVTVQLVRLGAFQRKLFEAGYKHLPSPRGVCMRRCHSGSENVPHTFDFPEPALPMVPGRWTPLKPFGPRSGPLTPIEVGPRIKPVPVEPPQRDKERACRDVCGASLPIVWPAELPLPGGDLERVSRSDDDWFSPPRGSDQARLADRIRRAREQTKAGVPTPPPQPCFADDADPYELYHAHHRHPLFLGGWEDPTNLCALKDARHRAGHRLLTNQIFMFMTDSTWRSCRMCSSILTKHGVGQQYEIDPSPWPF